MGRNKPDKPKPEKIPPFPKLNSKDLSQAPEDQASLEVIKRRYLAFAAELGPLAQQTIIENLGKVKTTTSNENVPSSHGIWKQSKWNIGHWILLSSIYDESKLSGVKSRFNFDISKFNDPGPAMIEAPEKPVPAAEDDPKPEDSRRTKRQRGNSTLPRDTKSQKLSDQLGPSALEYAKTQGKHLFNCPVDIQCPYLC